MSSLAARFNVRSAGRTFLNAQPVQDAVGKEAARTLSLWGMDVRQTDRKSIKPSKRKTLADMSPEERQRFRIQQSMAERDGKPKPQKPRSYEPSEPGEAPRRGPLDLLRKWILSLWDTKTMSVVIGAVKLGGVAGEDAPETIEYGGITRITHGENEGDRRFVAARPHTTPAYEKHLPKLPPMFRNLI